jgi:hypothetical protein
MNCPDDQRMSVHDRFLASNVSSRERAFLVEALELLMRERSNALRIATAVTTARGDRLPDVQDFGLDGILRLSRQLSDSAGADPHESWLEAQAPVKTRVSRSRRRTSSASVSNIEQSSHLDASTE